MIKIRVCLHSPELTPCNAQKNDNKDAARCCTEGEGVEVDAMEATEVGVGGFVACQVGVRWKASEFRKQGDTNGLTQTDSVQRISDSFNYL